MTPEEQAVKDAAAAAAAEPTELEKQLAEKDALIAKIAADRDNYKKGMLKAKGKKTDDDDSDDEENIDTKVARLVNEKLLDSQYNQAQIEKDNLIKEALKRNKELETALKNGTGIARAATGSGSEQKLTIKDPVLSEEKLNQLKAMGWDDKKIDSFKKNLLKSK